MTQVKLARTVKKSRQHIAQCETGKKQPSLDLLKKVLAVAGLTIEDCLVFPEIESSPDLLVVRRKVAEFISDGRTEQLVRILSAYEIQPTRD